jgi:hypothetical protein
MGSYFSAFLEPCRLAEKVLIMVVDARRLDRSVDAMTGNPRPRWGGVEEDTRKAEFPGPFDWMATGLNPLAYALTLSEGGAERIIVSVGRIAASTSAPTRRSLQSPPYGDRTV